MPGNYIIRRYRPEDREAVFALYKDVHGNSKAGLSKKNWIWEYESSPYLNDGPYIWVAESDNMIIGMHPAIPASLKCGEHRIRALWSADLMTHPARRHEGIFKALTDRMIDEAVKSGISAFLVLPNSNSGPLLRKRGWDHIRSFKVMIKPLRLLPLLRQVSFRSLPKAATGGWTVAGRAICRLTRGRKISTSPAISFRRIREFDSRFDELFERFAAQYDFIIVRDSQYLNWRYADCPSDKYTVFAAENNGRLFGMAVVSTEMIKAERGHIVELMAEPGLEYDAILEGLVQQSAAFLRSAGAASIEICSAGNAFDSVLKNAGFAEIPPHTFWSYDCLAHVPGNPELTGRMKDPSGKWFISRGDADSDMTS